MEALEVMDRITLPDARVALCGDWHGNIGWVRTLAKALPRLAPDVRTIMQLGDWWMDPGADALLVDAGIERVYVTLGNHEHFGDVTPLLEANPGHAIRVSDITWILPRPGRLTIGGRSVLSLGGATSVDKAWRREGVSWWPDEDITEEQVKAAIGGGRTDLMLTHESPDCTPVREVLRTNPLGFPDDALADSLISRQRVSQVWDAVQPTLLAHGHMHAPGGGQTNDGRRVASLGRDTQQGSIAFLDMFTLTMQTPSLRDIREAASSE